MSNNDNDNDNDDTPTTEAEAEEIARAALEAAAIEDASNAELGKDTAVETSEPTPQPTTALIVLGDAMICRPDPNILAVSIVAKEKLASALTGEAKAASIETLHLVLKASDVLRLYDTTAMTSIVSSHVMANATVTVHMLVTDGSMPTDDDNDAIKLSLVLAELKLTEEQENPDGSRTFTATTTGVGTNDDEKDSDER